MLHVAVDTETGMSGITLVCVGSTAEPETLESGVPATNIVGFRSLVRYYTMEIPADAISVTCTLSWTDSPRNDLPRLYAKWDEDFNGSFGGAVSISYIQI